MDGITDSMDMNLSKLQEMMRNREAWRAVVHVSQRIGWDLANNHIYHLKINILTISKFQFSGMKYIHIAVYPSAQSISRIFSSCKTASLDPVNNNSHFLLPLLLATTNLLSVSRSLTP